MTPAELLDAHPHVTALTLDFFDTLVTRAVAQPTHVLAVMEERLVAAEGQRWSGFAVRRVVAERRARSVLTESSEHSDVTLDDILRELAADIGLTLAERAMLARLEQDTEVELARPVRFGAELLAAATARGMKSWIVSDNYMPAAHLVRMAKAAGISLEREQVIVSCEHGAMKHDGSLWSKVIEIVAVEPRQILHVGDLHDADGSIPARRGLNTHVNDSMRRVHREPLNTCPALLPLSRMEAVSRDESASGDWDAVINLARGALALVVAGQVMSVERIARSRPLAGVHFTSRDGYLARDVYSVLWEGDRSLPSPGYLEVSRSVTWRALLTEVNDATVHRFVGDDERLSASRLSARFGCELRSSHRDDHVLGPDELRRLMVDNADAIVDSCRALRVRLLEYLDRIGATSPGHHVLMDLGWSGSVVADLAQIVREDRGPEVTFEGVLTGLYWDASSNRQRIPLCGLAFDEFMTMDDNVRLLGMIRFFESMLTAPHGSVVDYSGGVPVHSANVGLPDLGLTPWGKFESNTRRTAAEIVRGIHPLVRKEEVSGDVVRAAMLQVGHTPTMLELDSLASACHETAIDHAGTGINIVGPAPSGVRLEDIPSVYDDLIRHRWMQGTLVSWEANETTRWIADEVRKFGPMMGPQWVQA